jgi:hypothetical protein
MVFDLVGEDEDDRFSEAKFTKYIVPVVVPWLRIEGHCPPGATNPIVSASPPFANVFLRSKPQSTQLNGALNMKASHGAVVPAGHVALAAIVIRVLLLNLIS